MSQGPEERWLQDMAAALPVPPVDPALAPRIAGHLRTLPRSPLAPGLVWWLSPLLGFGLAAVLLWLGAACGLPLLPILDAAFLAVSALGAPAAAVPSGLVVMAAAVIVFSDALLVLWITHRHGRHTSWEHA